MKNLLVIALSSSLSNRALFERKTFPAVSNLDEFDVISINDERGYVRESFGGKIIEGFVGNAMKYESIRRLVQQATHFIVFWDGHDLAYFVHEVIASNKQIKLISYDAVRIVNKDRGDAYDYYIGRGTLWGNPFPIGVEGSRDEVIQKYKCHFYENVLTDPAKKAALHALKGKILACHCKPAACHGDVIAEYLNSLDENT